MNTSNPLLPQGSLQQNQSRSKSTLRVVLTIFAVHAVIFTGLLWQGCNPDKSKTGSTLSTSTNVTNELPRMPDTTYYTNAPELPTTTTNPPTPLAPAPNEFVQQTNKAVLPGNNPATEPPPKTTEAKEYTVAKNDTLGKIAKAHNVTLSDLTKANPNVEPTRLKIGQKIQIPATTVAASTGGPGLAESGAGQDAKIHVVKANENLFGIAKQNKTTVPALRAANNLKTDRLSVGQKLKLPLPKATATNTSAGASGSSSPQPTTNLDRNKPLTSGPMNR